MLLRYIRPLSYLHFARGLPITHRGQAIDNYPLPPLFVSSHWTLPSMCKTAAQAVLRRMQLTLHATTRPTPHGVSRLVQAMYAWSVKTRRAPFRHFGGSRVYGHTTTAMHDMSTCTPPVLNDVSTTPFTSRVISRPHMRDRELFTQCNTW